MSFRLSTLITASILSLALANTGTAVAGDGKSCGGKKEDGTSAAVERPTTRLISARLQLDHIA